MTAAVPLEPPAGATAFVYASWGRRFLALALDWLFLSIALTALIAQAPSSAEGWFYFLFWPALILALGGYFTAFHGGTRGQTFGKRLLGIAVRDAVTQERIGYARAFGRWLVGLLLWGFPIVGGFLDGLWPLWDERKQALHDKVVRSVVVRV